MSSERREALRELSYGGVVVRGSLADGTAEVVTIVPRGKTLLALPKGGADADETGAQTAVREVREEAGVNATVRAELGDVTYWYRRSGRAVRKTVRFYLCEYVDGSTEDHDHEVEEARWVPLMEAATALAYPGEREMIARAQRLLADSAADR
jgi:8-oxo-dGTP pyrophosphatase MutT (NUDIX family)